MQAIATPGPANRFFTNHETRNTAFPDTKFETGPLGTEALQSFFSAGGRFRLRVMTLLLGTKTSSAPVGDKSGGDRRAARATAFQVFTKHETRDTNHGFFSPWMRKGRTIRNRRLDRRARRPVAAFLRVVARHGAAMARHGRHGAPRAAASLFTIVHHCSRLFTIVHHCSRLFGIVQQKILRLSQCPLSVLTGNGACKVFTNHETRDKKHGLYAFHESRITNHETRPLFPPPCGLLLLRSTPKETILRKENVLSCTKLTAEALDMPPLTCISHHVAR